MQDQPMIPGHVLPLCASCAHRGDDFHPMPCGRCFWQGARHYKPDLQRDGDGAVQCSGFAPADAPDTREGDRDIAVSGAASAEPHCSLAFFSASFDIGGNP